MSITLISAIRDGLVAQLPAGAVPDDTGRVTLPAAVMVGTQESTPVDVGLLGPGDVAGVDPRQVIRMDPPSGAQGTEPSFFCMIEFDRPDFPWLFSPGAADAQGRLQPWLALLVVEVREGIGFGPRAGASLPVLTVDDLAELPDLDDAWAWAHAQISGPAATAEQVTAAVRGQPAATLSRLLCPRLLRSATRYRACVVPTFEVGRRAGLGDEPAGGSDPAWTASTATPLELPVYHSWEFVTGEPGDFETLARRIVAVPAPAGIGTSVLDIADPGAAALERPGAALAFAGPLRARGQATQPWNDDLARLALTALVDGAGPTVVGPPLYGGRAAAVVKVPPEPNPRPAWLRDLNLDPRHRATAALGARIVQEHQEELMRAAWEQAGAIEEVNRRLRAARLARRAGQTIVDGRLAKLSPPVLFALGGPALDHVAVHTHGSLARARLADTRLPAGLTQPAFRRLTRPGGRLGRMMGGFAKLGGVTDALDAGRALPDRGATMRPGGLVTAGGLLAAARAAQRSSGRGGRPIAIEREAAPDGLPDPDARAPLVAATRTGGRSPILRIELTDRDRVVGGGSLVVADVRFSRSTPLERMAEVFAQPELVEGLEGTVQIERAGQAFDLTEEVRGGLLGVLVEPKQPVPGPTPAAALATLRDELLAGLDPALTVPAALRLSVAVPEALQGDDPLDEVLAAPSFPSPLALELAGLSSDLLLPGADRVPDNGAFALVTNSAYVQALLVGANDEMARELRWRGYPTDERGTCFRFFWDASGTTAPGTEPAPEIRPIHEFAKAGRLGDEVGGGRNQVVLLLRAELFRRYPGTQVLAVPGEPDGAGGRRPRYDAPVLPRFRGLLGADMMYFGFPFDDVAAVGDPGFYAVYQQPPGAPRFGLDEPDASTDPAVFPATRSALTWAHVLTGDATYVDLDGVTQAFTDVPSVRWGESAAGQAIITMQQPVRVAIHFSDLLAGG